MYLDKAKEKEGNLHQTGIAQFIPCTEEQVASLEDWYGHALPRAYREFLFWMGSWGGGFLIGSHCFYGELKDIQTWARTCYGRMSILERCLKMPLFSGCIKGINSISFVVMRGKILPSIIIWNL